MNGNKKTSKPMYFLYVYLEDEGKYLKTCREVALSRNFFYFKRQTKYRSHHFM
jgi:hypothetical protein